MNEEQQTLLELRGDLLSFLLHRNQKLLQAQFVRLNDLVDTLERANVPKTTADGKETQGSLLIKAIKFLASEASAMHEVNATTLSELEAYGEQYEVGNTVDESLTKVINGLRQASPVYAKMTDEEIKQKLGLQNDAQTH